MMKELYERLHELHVDNVLDLATRDGKFAIELARDIGSCKEIIATDVTGAAFGRYAEEAAAANVRFGIADACSLPYPDNCFDIVSVSNSLHHIPDLAALFSEMKRVVKPEGLLLICEMYCDSQPRPHFSHWLLHSIEADLDAVKAVYHAQTYSKAHIMKMVEMAGLTVLDSFCGHDCSPSAAEKLSDRVSKLPETVLKCKGCPAYYSIAAKLACLQDEFSAYGIAPAEQLCIIARKQQP